MTTYRAQRIDDPALVHRVFNAPAIAKLDPHRVNRTACLEKKASLYLVNSDDPATCGFLVCSILEGKFWVNTIMGHNLYTPSGVALLKKVCREEGCGGIGCQVSDPRKKRCLARLGFNPVVKDNPRAPWAMELKV